MKKTVLALVLAGMATASVSSAFASESVDLKVTGTLIVGSCTPTIPNSASVDYGDVPVAGLNATSANALGDKSTDFTVSCESPMKVGFITTDDRSDSEMTGLATAQDATHTFGLGFADASSNIPIGGYNVELEAPTYDSTAGSILTSTDSGSTWNVTTNANMVNGGTEVYTVGTSAGVPVAFKSATFPLKVSASTQATNTLNLVDDTPIDGQATITLKYL